MRFRKYRVLYAVVGVVIFLILLKWKSFNVSKVNGDRSPSDELLKKRNLNQVNVSFVILDFEDFDNDVEATAASALHSCNHSCNVFVISEHLVYPPIMLPKGANHIVLKPDIYKQPPNVYSLLKDSKYVFFMPDGGRISSSSQLKEHINILNNGEDFQILALSIGAIPLNCYKYVLDIRSWLLDITATPQSEACDGISGRAALLLKTSDLLKLVFPISRPVISSLSIQGTARKWKIHIGRGMILGEGRQLYGTDHLQWKHESLVNERVKLLYKNFGIKKVVDSDRKVLWYGCKRTTPRCFPQIFNDTPSYLYEGRWTPPCCLEGLRITARHVFQTLKSCHIRWWLEGGSLLGAVRTGDLVPWDFNVDIGMYEKDLDRCPQLKSSRWQILEDNKGFVWQKASNGNYFQVHYSTTNHLNVDIFPFRSKDGMMIRGSWSLGHRQDVDFPEHFLKPLSSMSFIGVPASVPNNVRDFLEFKFGVGVVENPKYPNPEALKNTTII